MFEEDDLIAIIRQLIRHHELDKDEIVSLFINAIGKEANQADTSASEIYELIIKTLITGEIR